MTATSARRLESRRNDQGRFTELEGLRALAAVAVLLTHAGFLSGATGRHMFPGFLARMDIGVPIFFVLSGFLLYRPHARHLAGVGSAPSGTTYFIRRFARLIPAWILALLGTLMLVPVVRGAPKSTWIANLLQLQSLKAEWDLPGLAQLWSLSTEASFYIALPVIAWLLGRCASSERGLWLGLATLVAGTWVFRVLAGLGALPDGYSWLRTLPATGDWFVVGMALAVIVTSSRTRARIGGIVAVAPWHLYGLAAAIFWVLTTRAAGPYDLTPPTAIQASVKHLGYTVFAGLVVAPSVLGARTVVSRLLTSPVMTYVGRISYGIFLWHLPVMFAVRRWLDLQIFTGGFWITVVVTLIISCVVAGLSWHWVESPIQSWAHRRTRRSDTPRDSHPHENERQKT